MTSSPNPHCLDPLRFLPKRCVDCGFKHFTKAPINFADSRVSNWFWGLNGDLGRASINTSLCIHGIPFLIVGPGRFRETPGWFRGCDVVMLSLSQDTLSLGEVWGRPAIFPKLCKMTLSPFWTEFPFWTTGKRVNIIWTLVSRMLYIWDCAKKPCVSDDKNYILIIIF